ncbi:MAG TPA: beta-L-arabinofuranosidase domain-containing protein [Chthoniobacteraceae bacterium]|jgi:hypothetical protein|nr:beta-L-arabinofuranosidase domain-containing protein [Chthoniobacteraceae bacterium]
MKSLLTPILLGLLMAAGSQAQIADVSAPPVSGSNAFYIGNRAPLLPGPFLPLPTTAIHPQGWLLETLHRQRDGLCGHLGEISAWLEKDGNAWLSKDGKGSHGWEEVPYWLRGYLELAYLLNDPKMIAESQTWINGALASQRPDGDFGPDQRFGDGSRDFWANMLMLYCLESYYDHTQDARVLELMTRYFHFQATIPDAKMLTHYWQKMRGGDELYSIYWLYNRTGDASLLALADKIHRRTANWEMKDDLPNWHNVNIAECFREPATYYLQTHRAADLAATYADFHVVRNRYGQVPGGMFGGDEICRPTYSDPRQGTETCGMVEQMLSDEILLRISGDPAWADHCENVAFNSYPAALSPDLRALRYLTAPNMVVSDSKDHAPGIANAGPFLMMNPFSSRCCQHNHSMGWPYLAKNLWLATPDNGLCAAIYSASTVTARVGNGTTVGIEEATHYPFEARLDFTIHAASPVTFPLYLRVPGWCAAAAVAINGQRADVAAKPDSYLRMARQWRDGDRVTLELPMALTVQRWPANHDCASVNYGPLTFSLKIAEKTVPVDSTKTAIGDSGWQKTADPSKWPAFDLYPASPWNYGLVLDESHPESALKVHQSPWPANNFPFTPETAPITVEATGARIPQWTLDQFELCSTLQQSPARSGQPDEKVTLIPMGAARLRISAFPVIGNGPDSHAWITAN